MKSPFTEMVKVTKGKEKVKEKVEIFSPIENKQKTYERLKNHSIYYCEDFGNSYEDII